MGMPLDQLLLLLSSPPVVTRSVRVHLDSPEQFLESSVVDGSLAEPAVHRRSAGTDA